MTRIVVSGASGDMGKRITKALLEKIAPSDLILTTRTPEKIRASVPAQVQIFKADYRDRAALEEAYRGGEVLMLISSLDVTHRVPEHRNAIEAAKTAGIRHIVYTSSGGIHPRNPVLSVSDHIVTERDLQASGLGHTIFRNQTYAEVFPTLAAPAVIGLGIWNQAAGEGRLAPVSKRDITRCAVACLLDPEWHDGAVYEITGPELLSFRDIARITADALDVELEYQPVSAEQRYRQLDAMAVPRKFTDDMPTHEFAQRWCSDEMVSQDLGFAGNFYAVLSDHVELITGQKPIPLREVYEFCRGKDYNHC